MYTLPDVTTQNPADYKANIDESATIHDAVAGAFYAYEAATPNMTVVINAGKVQNGTTLTDVAAQTTVAFVAPSGNPRIDRIVIDNVTGVYSVIAGTEAASPVAPDLTAGKIAICQVLLDNSPATTAITNSLITDERAVYIKEYIKLENVIATTSGTTVDYTNIPSWVKKITIMFDAVSNNGAGSDYMVQIGDSGGLETSGYKSVIGFITGSVAGSSTSVSSFLAGYYGHIDDTISGATVLTLLDESTNTWCCSVGTSVSGITPRAIMGGGGKSLTGALDRLRISTVAGHTFDAGKVNISYE